MAQGKFLRYWLSLLLCGWTALVLAACRRPTMVSQGDREGVLHIGNGVEPISLDPQISTGVSEMNIHFALFEGLVRFSGNDLSPLPGAAESWEVSPDGLEWTFHLRAQGRWSNGDPVQATDFLFAWQRILHPALGAANAYLLYPVRNAQAFHEGQVNFTETGFSAPDHATLRLRLARPCPGFLPLVMHPAWFPLHPGTILAHGSLEARTSHWTKPGNHVGNGPFRLAEHRIHTYLRVEKNPYYHGADQVRLQAIVFYPIEDKHAEELAFLAGGLHLTYSLPPGQTSVYQQKKDPRLQIDPYLGTDYYLLNTRQPPLDDPRVRLALSKALCREDLTRYVLAGGQRPAYTFLPPGIDGYTPADLIAENETEARELLAAAGFPEGRRFPELEILFNQSETNRKIAEAVQERWRKVLGLHLTLQAQEYRVYLENRRLGHFSICRASWIGDTVDAPSFLGLWSGTSGNNFSGWSDAQFDQLLEASASCSGQARLEHLRKAEALLLQASPMIPLYHNISACLVQPSVRGWRRNVLGWPAWSEVWLE